MDVVATNEEQVKILAGRIRIGCFLRELLKVEQIEGLKTLSGIIARVDYRGWTG